MLPPISPRGTLSPSVQEACCSHQSKRHVAPISPRGMLSPINPRGMLSAISPRGMLSAISPRGMLSPISPRDILSPISPRDMFSHPSKRHIVDISPRGTLFTSVQEVFYPHQRHVGPIGLRGISQSTQDAFPYQVKKTELISPGHLIHIILRSLSGFDSSVVSNLRGPGFKSVGGQVTIIMWGAQPSWKLVLSKTPVTFLFFCPNQVCPFSM